ncbi:hypothetical protein [Polluticoccus soli]|uniref:hypothetical protein n=1 Tax=Polluticoccus soli TaxID=3034150 RepID=UPI0023E273F1|nr:hypothetical protein [Flavipsychrobacter sp. JY13-12]
MKQNFTKRISFEGKIVLAVIIPEHRQDGMYYEVNVKNYPRFYVTMSSLGRYDIVSEPGLKIPYELILAVSDAIEEHGKK